MKNARTDYWIEINTTDVMRYDTLGDWFRNGAGTNVIEVRRLDDMQLEFCVALHELVEWFLCQQRGITQEQVDKFDMAQTDDGEPGEMAGCPYGREHEFSTIIERLMVEELGLDWGVYLSKLEGGSNETRSE